jgi:hypothetical protein
MHLLRGVFFNLVSRPLCQDSNMYVIDIPRRFYAKFTIDESPNKSTNA